MQVVKYDDVLAEENVRIIREVIAGDGVMIYPTDTLYGLGGNFCSPAVMETIDRIKQRKDMPYSVMVANMEMMGELAAEIPEVFYRLAGALLPGKFTFLFRVSPSVDPILVKGGNKIGIRIPAAPAMLQLIKTINVPFITTSVNRSGDPPMNRSEDILRQLGAAGAAGGPGVSLFIDAGDLPPSRGSTILDITVTPVKCIRKGDDYHKLEAMGLDLE